MSERPIAISEIQRAVCDRFGMSMIEMRSNRRQRVLARPRQVAMYLSRELTARSLAEIGRMFGNRDHTTVSYACRKVHALANTDPELAQAIADLRYKLTPSEVVDPNQLLLALPAQTAA